jgi:acyl-CoA thioesterase-2
MGDLGVDTAVTALGDGRYTAHVSRDWEIWGPEGGYIASLALRAAGAESTFGRPASFFCHYLGVARFEPVDLEVTKLRGGRNAESFRVMMTQDGKPILEATLWTIGDVDGLDHALAVPPTVPDPEDLPTIAELMAEVEDPDGPRFRFWDNFDARPIHWQADWPPSGPLDPVFRQWERFVPTSTFADPWVDAARAVVLIDVVSWPSASSHHAWKWPNGQEWIAPSLDLYVAFHHPAPDDPWLLVDGHSPVARDGLIGWNGRLWSSDRTLVASGSGQLLCRRVPVVAPPAGA